jgi:hypothetical protein
VSQAYLLDIEWRLDLCDVDVKIGFERLDVNGLSDSSRHGWTGVRLVITWRIVYGDGSGVVWWW